MTCTAWEAWDPISGEWIFLDGTPTGTFDVDTGRVGGPWTTPDVEPPESQVTLQRAVDIPRAWVVSGFSAKFFWYYNADHDLMSLDFGGSPEDSGRLQVSVSMKISGNAAPVSMTISEARGLTSNAVSHVGAFPNVQDDFAAGDGWDRITHHFVRAGFVGATCFTETDAFGSHSHAYTVPAGFSVGGVQYVTVTIEVLIRFEFLELVDFYPNPGQAWVLPIDFIDANGGSIFCSPTGPCGCLPFDGIGTPLRNQPVQDEVVATGDGTTTLFTTDWAYNPVSLQVEVSGLLGEVDMTDPAAKQFTLVPAPPLGAPITATYRAA